MDPNVGSNEETGKRKNEVERRKDFLSSKEDHRMTYHKHRTDIIIISSRSVYLSWSWATY
jgi:hypothetical protein